VSSEVPLDGEPVSNTGAPDILLFLNRNKDRKNATKTHRFA